MRITGGIARSIPIFAPAGELVRPATDQLREAVYSSIGEVIRGARVLDAFAGTGSYGIEALSRGAASVIFLEQHRGALKALDRNLAALRKSMTAAGATPPTTQVLPSDFFRWRPFERYDVLIADPPYETVRERAVIILEKLRGCAHAEATVILEGPGDFEPPVVEGLDFRKRLGKGSKQPCALIYRVRA